MGSSLGFWILFICLFICLLLGTRVCVWVQIFAQQACRNLKRSEEAVDPLELELQIVVSHHVGTGNWTWILCRSRSTVNCWDISPCLSLAFWALDLCVGDFPISDLMLVTSTLRISALQIIHISRTPCHFNKPRHPTQICSHLWSSNPLSVKQRNDRRSVTRIQRAEVLKALF